MNSHDINNGFSTLLDSHTVCRLADTSVISVTGPDNRRFLQGQLSCNMDRLSQTQSLRAALCNLKGRVIADMRVVLQGDTVLLYTQAEMAAVIMATLDRYRVFFKTTLENSSHEHTRFVLIGKLADQVLEQLGLQAVTESDRCSSAQGVTVVRLPSSALYKQARYECLINLRSISAQSLALLDKLVKHNSELAWRLADIRSGLAHVRPGQQERFTPQLLNYDLNGTIDFKKGCYTGQEVVARMFYRAEAKKRLFHLAARDNIAIEEDDVLDQVSLNGQMELLCVMAQTDAGSMPGVSGFY